MTPSTAKRFCVAVTMADYYSAWIEASDENHALTRGIERWNADQGEFHFDRTERLSVDVVDWEYV